MKAQALIKFIFVLLLAGSAFQFTLLFKTYQIEQEAQEKAIAHTASLQMYNSSVAQQEFVQSYLDSLSDQVVFEVPYLCKYTYKDLKSRQLKLGLDLQGGLQLGIAFDAEHFLRDLAQQEDDPQLQAALEAANSTTRLQAEEYIHSFFQHYQQRASRQEIIQQFSNHPALSAYLHSQLPLSQFGQQVQDLAKETVRQTHFLLQKRIDALGFSEARLALDENRQLILIELPGVKSPESLKKTLLPTASLEFWPTYRITDPGIHDALLKADQLLKSTQ